MIDCLQARDVAVVCDRESQYPELREAPFHPSERYPEFGDGPLSPTSNRIFGMVREILCDLGFDRRRFGTPDWNPLGDLIPPGRRIVIKPNWVMHRNEGGSGLECLITHPSILRAVIDYAALANPVEIVVGDAPLQGCDFDALVGWGSRSVIEWFVGRGVPVRLVDFRRTTLTRDGFALNVQEEIRPLEDYVVVDLGERSLLEPLSARAKQFRVTMYDPQKMFQHHRPGLHRYLVSKEVLSADLVINLPKLKTHKKAGITAALKNLVGINGNKDYLPHHRKGPVALGGDNYEHFSFLKYAAEELLDAANRHLHHRLLSRELNRLVYFLLVLNMQLGGTGEVEGGWYGNDTVWRMCLDLNRILFYADLEGNIADGLQRMELSLGDAIVAGEGEGPLKPEPRSMHVLVASLNPVAADWVSALLMGFDPAKVPVIARAFDFKDAPVVNYSSQDIACRVNGKAVELDRLARSWGCRLKPPAGWLGHCES